MNPALTILDLTWSKRHWSWAVGLVFGGQLLLIFLLTDRAPGHPRSAGEVTRFSVALDESANARLNDPLRVDDPTLFALPNSHGFSGRAWLAAPSFRNPSAGWTEPPTWLAASSTRLGQEFIGFALTNAPVLLRMAGKPEPRLTDLADVPEPNVPRSVVRVEGALQARPLATQPLVPDLPHEDVLRSSVVQVLVKADGEIFSATLRSGSGLKAADDRALELARKMRFAPLKPGGDEASAAFTAGTLIFTWHTVAPVAVTPP